ncbi:MAG: DUF502 domain-containing protein [Bdellovibrionales bacterium]|nr:DUF502 domain-containing protein [Bdellovibrionales bacterium]
MNPSPLRFVSQTFLRGLGVLLPIGVTAYLLYTCADIAEEMIRSILLLFLPEEMYLPGLGIIIATVFVFVVGWSVRYLPVEGPLSLLDALFDKIPVVRTIYSSAKDFSDFVAGKTTDKFSKAVLVRIPEFPLSFLGYLTSPDVRDDIGVPSEEGVLVYLPMSYQLGGYSIIVPRDWVQEIDLSSEAALKYILTAGISKGKRDSEKT